jgi:hypothetical protein
MGAPFTIEIGEHIAVRSASPSALSLPPPGKLRATKRRKNAGSLLASREYTVHPILALGQIVIVPHGDLSDGPEKYIIAAVTLALLCVAAWRFFKIQR